MTYDDRGHSALPKLYGAPAYSRPPTAATAGTNRPLSADDLPIEAERTDEDLAMLEEVAAAPGSSATSASSAADGTRGPGRKPAARPFRLGGFGSLIRGRPDGPHDAGR